MRLIFVTIITFACLLSFGQSNHDTKNSETHTHQHIPNEQVESLRIAFLTNKLDLSPGEAQLFWPVYNEYLDKKRELKSKRSHRAELADLDNDQANQLLDTYLETKQKEIDLDKAYVEKFKEVLPSKKVIMVFVLERRFKEEILKDVKRRLNASNN